MSFLTEYQQEVHIAATQIQQRLIDGLVDQAVAAILPEIHGRVRILVEAWRPEFEVYRTEMMRTVTVKAVFHMAGEKE